MARSLDMVVRALCAWKLPILCSLQREATSTDPRQSELVVESPSLGFDFLSQLPYSMRKAYVL